MQVRMKVALSGMRDGVEWPPVGSVIDLPDAEAIQYISGGMADPVALFGDATAERAVVPSAEQRTPDGPTGPDAPRRPLTTRTGPRGTRP